MLLLLALLILGIVWVASALLDQDAASMESLYGVCSGPGKHEFMELCVARCRVCWKILSGSCGEIVGGSGPGWQVLIHVPCFQISGTSTYPTSTLASPSWAACYFSVSTFPSLHRGGANTVSCVQGTSRYLRTGPKETVTGLWEHLPQNGDTYCPMHTHTYTPAHVLTYLYMCTHLCTHVPKHLYTCTLTLICVYP